MEKLYNKFRKGAIFGGIAFATTFGCLGTGALKADTEEVKQLVFGCTPNSVHYHVEADNTELFVVREGNRRFIVILDGDLNVRAGSMITVSSYNVTMRGLRPDTLPSSLQGILHAEDNIPFTMRGFNRNSATGAWEIEAYGLTIVL